MAVSNKVPPQAYTRDTLVKAIEWMSSQPESVRERAKSADLMVSHYLQAKRNVSPNQLDLPMSSEGFKSDLHQLAADFYPREEFAPPPPPTPTRSPSYIVPPPMHAEPTVTPSEFFSSEPRRTELRRREPPTVRPEPQAPALPPAGPTWEIDNRSLQIARELQDRLNLSCEGEAIRLLITMGAERARGLFF